MHPAIRQVPGAKCFHFQDSVQYREQHFSHNHVGSPEDVILNRVRSTSFIARLPIEERTNVEAQIENLLSTEPKLIGKTVIAVPYETTAVHTTKQ
jgi:hypothetical protein